MIKKLGLGCGGLILVLIVLSVALGSSRQPTTVQPAASGATAQSTGAAQARVGDTVRSGNWEYTVTKVEKVKTITWSDFGNKTDAAGVWLVISITLKNVGDRNFPINATDFQVTADGTTKYDPSTKLEAFSFVRYVKLTNLGEQFPPGVEVKTAVLFDINPDSKGLRLVLKQANNSTIALE